MADDADRANDYLDLTMSHCLSRAPKFDKPSLTECLECGEDIPARRQAVGGGIPLCPFCGSTFYRNDLGSCYDCFFPSDDRGE